MIACMNNLKQYKGIASALQKNIAAYAADDNQCHYIFFGRHKLILARMSDMCEEF